MLTAGYRHRHQDRRGWCGPAGPRAGCLDRELAGAAAGWRPGLTINNRSNDAQDLQASSRGFEAPALNEPACRNDGNARYFETASPRSVLIGLRLKRRW